MKLGVALLAAYLALAGCTPTRPTRTPMDTLSAYSAAVPHDTLLVLLPGLRDRPQTFVREGFVQEIEKRALPVSVLAVDAHFGYYKEQSIVQRLREDVILPARQRGFRTIWLVGISLGGWGSLQYARTHPQEIQGMVLLAPYVGPEDVEQAIGTAGGLDAWQPSEAVANDPRAGWVWFKHYRAGVTRPRVYLGFGATDRFAPGLSKLRERLPASDSAVAPGGHDWPAWNALLGEFLDRGILQESTRQ
jgi:pimeloyl-ACP methyl ester carboxylesterase